MVGAFLSLLVVGCGAASPAAGPTAAGPTPTVTVPVPLPAVISLAGRFERAEWSGLDEQIAAFEEANPDVRVEVVQAPRTAPRHRAWVASRLAEGDTSIDVYVLDAAWTAELAATGGLVPLDEQLPTYGVEPDAFLPAAIEVSSYDGQLAALPWVADGGLLYYRRDLLDRYGYTAPTSWKELQRQALEIQSGEGLAHGYVWAGEAGEDLTCSTLEQVWSLGGDLVDESGTVVFDSPETRAGLQQMKDLILSGASPEDVATYDALTALAAFHDGQAVFLRDWFVDWDLLDGPESPVAGRAGVAPLPAACAGGKSLGLSAHSLHQDEALRLMAFLSGYEAQVEMALSAGKPPALEAAYDDANLLEGHQGWETVRAAFSAARARPGVANYAQISEVIYTEVNLMLQCSQDPETTADRVQAGLKALP
jgi:multiple sugar transport system substrate-binding protein